MRKTKIICTMGPNSNDYEVLKQLAAYMDCARFNFSHGDYEEHKNRLESLKKVREEVKRPIPALLDTKGPEIRTGLLKDGKKVSLVAGNKFILTTEEITGSEEKVFINYSGIINDIKVGNHILIDDGLIELEVVDKNKTDIITNIISGGELGEKKGVNVPNVKIQLPDLTDKDKNDILFGIKEGFDIIAASFVRSASCIREIKKILQENNSKMMVIAKIENHEGISNIDEIIEEADGIMVARGDLGVEIDATELPHLQKEIIKKCNAKGKIVITATQMLDSMIRNIRPTRAEVSDVANAIYDGTDLVMLSGETANGAHPIEAIKMMNDICLSTEANVDYSSRREHLFQTDSKKSITKTVCRAVVNTSMFLDVKAIIAPTKAGNTAKVISKYKPHVPIYALSDDVEVVRKLMLCFGVKPFLSEKPIDTDDLLRVSLARLKDEKYIDVDDVVVIARGISFKNRTNTKYHTNVMRVEIVE